MWECHSNPEGQAKPSQVLVLLFPQTGGVECSLLFFCLWPCCAGWGCRILGVGGVLLSGVARCSPWEGAQPHEGMEASSELDHLTLHPSLCQGRLIWTRGTALPCFVPSQLLGQQKASPLRGVRVLHPEPGTAAAGHSLPGKRHLLSRSHGNNVREAGGGQSQPGKPKAALTPSGRGDEAQHQPRLVFSLRGSEPTWEELPSGAGSCDPACS